LKHITIFIQIQGNTILTKYNDFSNIDLSLLMEGVYLLKRTDIYNKESIKKVIKN